MSLTITLYCGTRLTNKYDVLYKNRTSLETYLSARTKLQVYTGDDIYYTNSGTISIENGSLIGHYGNRYNYMSFVTSETINGNIITNYRYCFINNITLVNEVAVIDYEEDVVNDAYYGVSFM